MVELHRFQGLYILIKTGKGKKMFFLQMYLIKNNFKEEFIQVILTYFHLIVPRIYQFLVVLYIYTHIYIYHFGLFVFT